MQTQMTQTVNKGLQQNSLKKHLKPLYLLIQIQMTQTINKGLSWNSFKKHQKPMGCWYRHRQWTRTTTQKSTKTPEYLDDEEGLAVNYQRCIVMYSTEDEQEPAVKKLQKASKIPGRSGDEDPQETSPGPVHKESARPAEKLPAASCTHILISGVRKGKQCRFKASDKTGKFCYHHKQTWDWPYNKSLARRHD